MDKNSMYVDGIGDLYRACRCLLIGDKDGALDFLHKSRSKLGDKFDDSLIEEKDDHKMWAEKVLDKYTNLKIAQY